LNKKIVEVNNKLDKSSLTIGRNYFRGRKRSDATSVNIALKIKTEYTQGNY